jgi:hypothetical protein
MRFIVGEKRTVRATEGTGFGRLSLRSRVACPMWKDAAVMAECTSVTRVYEPALRWMTGAVRFPTRAGWHIKRAARDPARASSTDTHARRRIERASRRAACASSDPALVIPQAAPASRLPTTVSRLPTTVGREAARVS